MLVDQYRIGLLGYLFPAARREIDAFHQAFCPTRLTELPSEIHSFEVRATARNLVMPFHKLDLYPKENEPLTDDVHVLIEHIILVIDRSQEIAMTIPIHEGTPLKPIDCLRDIRPESVHYICSVRRRRLTVFAPTSIVFTLSELSLGILYRPTEGFDGLVAALRPTLRPGHP